jgi:predicted dehydrogenase
VTDTHAIREPSAVVGLGIVGCGGAAIDVVEAVPAVPGLAVVAAMDLDPSLAKDVVRRAGGRAHASIDDLLEDPAVAAVYVALPHDLLAPTARRVLDAGRHVLVEKPMGLEVEQVTEVGRRAEERGLVAGVLFELRCTSMAQAARRLIESGAIGTVRAVRVTTVMDKDPSYWRLGLTGRSHSPWRTRIARAGGGVLIMNAIHQIDLLWFLLENPVARAVGEVQAGVVGVEVEDVAAAALRLDNGAVVSIAASAHSAGAQANERIEIDGTDGALALPDPYRSPGVLRVYLRRPHDDLAAGRWHELKLPVIDPYAAALGGFAQAIRDGTPAPIGAADAARALRVVLDIYRFAGRSDARRADE